MSGPEAPFGGLRPRHTEAMAVQRWRAILRALLRLACIGIYALVLSRAVTWALF